jgi:hypothetical protein
MGGSGSGNWYRWDSKSTTESQHRIDIRWLKNQEYLRSENIGFLSWSRGKKQTGSIGYRMESDRMVLSYRHRSRGGEWENVEQVVLFDLTPCNFGGHRTWLLYGAGKYFWCRHCYNLTYSSQQESRADRLMRKARKIRARLGASNSFMEPILFKPKNMHQKTFDRLRKEADNARNLSMVIMGQRLRIII